MIWIIIKVIFCIWIILKLMTINNNQAIITSNQQSIEKILNKLEEK